MSFAHHKLCRANKGRRGVFGCACADFLKRATRRRVKTVLGCLCTSPLYKECPVHRSRAK
jgi:hypothetical protein